MYVLDIFTVITNHMAAEMLFLSKKKTVFFLAAFSDILYMQRKRHNTSAILEELSMDINKIATVAIHVVIRYSLYFCCKTIFVRSQNLYKISYTKVFT